MNGIKEASDCDTIGEIGKLTVYKFTSETIHSPYNEGISANTTAGCVFTYMNSTQYGIQLALMSGEVEGKGTGYLRGCNNGIWQDWHSIIPHSKRQTGITTDYGLTLDVIKCGFTVNVRIYGRVTSGSMDQGTDYTLTTLPEDYQPGYSMGWNCYTSQSGSYAPFLIRVDYDRTVHMNVSSNIDSLGYINISYVYGCDF